MAASVVIQPVVTTTSAPTPLESDDGPRNPITKAIVMRECVKHGFYRTPHCNEKLYLHHQGFDQIAGLDEYTEVTVLWLGYNCIRRIENLSAMRRTLRQLYLNDNVIERTDGLHIFEALDGLNLCNNFIHTLEGFTAPEGAVVGASDSSGTVCTPLDTLSTLQLKGNKLKTRDDIALLAQFKRLSVVDLSHNQLANGDDVLDVIGQMPALRSLQLTGNPCVRSIPNYRKTVIAKAPLLCYLDDRPVFDDERRLVTAWAAGGAEAEKAERAEMRREEEEAKQRQLAEFRELFGAHGDGDSDTETDSQSSAESAASQPQSNGESDSSHVATVSNGESEVSLASRRSEFFERNYAAAGAEAVQDAPAADTTTEIHWGGAVIRPKESAVPVRRSEVDDDEEAGDVWTPAARSDTSAV